MSQVANHLQGYTNLTAAIEEGTLDWEQLDGRKVQCVNAAVGTLHGVLERDPSYPACITDGWWNDRMNIIYTYALRDAWDGNDGWVLWVEGAAPTANN